MRMVWIADVLRAAGISVVEVAGWQIRGSNTVDPKVIVVHHTASTPPKPAPSLSVVTNGRPGIPGPLCNVLGGRDGVAYVIAAGRSNNAGVGSWKGISGNEQTFGLELENDGVGEPWGLARTVGVAVSAAVAKHLALSVEMIPGHKDWAPKRKIDPSFDMDKFRAEVAAVGQVKTPAKPVPVPLPEDDVASPTDIVGVLDCDLPPKDGLALFWVVRRNGAVEGRNGAPFMGSLQTIGVDREDVVGIVHRHDQPGYVVVCGELFEDPPGVWKSPTYAFPA